MKKLNYAEELSYQILAYLKEHPNSTQTEMQLALDFEFNHWKHAIAFLKGKVEKEKGNSSEPARYHLINP